MMLVPGCVSIRNVSHLPPAKAISALANAAPPLVTLGAVHHDGGAAAHAGLFLDHELHGLPTFGGP